MQSNAMKVLGVVGAIALGACLLPESASAAPAAAAPAAAPAGQAETSWHSQSLTTETVEGPNGSITTPTALSADARLGVTESKIAEVVTDGVYALRGWGIASCRERPEESAAGFQPPSAMQDFARAGARISRLKLGWLSANHNPGESDGQRLRRDGGQQPQRQPVHPRNLGSVSVAPQHDDRRATRIDA